MTDSGVLINLLTAFHTTQQPHNNHYIRIIYDQSITKPTEKYLLLPNRKLCVFNQHLHGHRFAFKHNSFISLHIFAYLNKSYLAYLSSTSFARWIRNCWSEKVFLLCLKIETKRCKVLWVLIICDVYPIQSIYKICIWSEKGLNSS